MIEGKDIIEMLLGASLHNVIHLATAKPFHYIEHLIVHTFKATIRNLKHVKS